MQLTIVKNHFFAFFLFQRRVYACGICGVELYYIVYSVFFPEKSIEDALGQGVKRKLFDFFSEDELWQKYAR